MEEEEEEPPIDGKRLSVEQLVEQSIKYGYDHHFPGRIRIRDILVRGFLLEDKTKEIVIGKIILYGLAKFADNKKLDLIITSEGVDAIESGHPIAYMKKIRENEKAKMDNSIKILGNVTNSQIGSNSHFGSQFNKFNESQAEKHLTTQKKSLWSSIPDWAKILTGIGSIAGLVKIIIELKSK